MSATRETPAELQTRVNASPFYRLLGFEVISCDRIRRFVPSAACSVSGSAVELAVRLAFFHEPELTYYREHGLSFVRLLGAPVRTGTRTLGRLVDLHFADATRRSLVLRDANGVDIELEAGLASAASPAEIVVGPPPTRLLVPHPAARVDRRRNARQRAAR